LLAVVLSFGVFSFAQEVSLSKLVTPSTVVFNDGHPVTFAIHAFIEFKSLNDAFPYIESQTERWKNSGKLDAAARQRLGRQLLHEAIESRVISTTDERLLELLITHTAEELKNAIAMVKETLPSGYQEAFLDVQEKWKHSLNCWSASPSIQGRVLSNWYPIEEGITLYGATCDSTEHFWQAVKYHPNITVARVQELVDVIQKKDWKPWLARLDNDPDLYLPNAYAVEFLRHNLAGERLQWFRHELDKYGRRASDRAGEVQLRHGSPSHFSAFEEKVRLSGPFSSCLCVLFGGRPGQESVSGAPFRCDLPGKPKAGFHQ